MILLTKLSELLVSIKLFAGDALVFAGQTVRLIQNGAQVAMMSNDGNSDHSPSQSSFFYSGCNSVRRCTLPRLSEVFCVIAVVKNLTFC